MDEELPPVERQTNDAAGDQSPAGPVILVKGSFRSLEHETRGTAKIIQLEDGHRLLRLEDLETSNGPDLRVYLSEIPESDDWQLGNPPGECAAVVEPQRREMLGRNVESGAA